MSDLRDRLEKRARARLRTATIGGTEIEYGVCRVLPETAMMLRDVLREARKLWRRHLGDETWNRLAEVPAAEDFFHGALRLDSVPPAREVVVLWLPVPPEFFRHVEPRLLDCYELVEPPSGLRLAPDARAPEA